MANQDPEIIFVSNRKVDDFPDPKILKEIQQRLEKGEHLWRIIDQYKLTTDQKIEILRLFDDQKWD